MKSRTIKEGIIRKAKSKTGRIVVLTGARQTGKTTLARLSFPELNYIALDDPVSRSQYLSMSASQWRNSFPSAILDEVQKAPSLIESIKSVTDQYSETHYILTGSSQLLLMEKVKESLAGRCSINEIFPLTIPEILTSRWEEPVKDSFFQQYLRSGEIPELLPSFIIDSNFAERESAFRYYLKFGGYPALVDPAISEDEKHEWLRGYVRTYLERDVRDLADFRSLDPFMKVQRMTSLLTGQVLNYSVLAREAGVTVSTASKFVNYLELSYQAILLRPWSRNKLKRLVKSPKLHYLDPGVQKAVIQKRGELTGNEFESAVVAEIYKQARNINYPVDFYHLRTVDGRETDILLEKENGYIAIEIKQSSNIFPGDARHIIGLESILDKPLLQSFVLSNDNRVKPLSERVMAIPAAMFLS